MESIGVKKDTLNSNYRNTCVTKGTNTFNRYIVADDQNTFMKRY